MFFDTLAEYDTEIALVRAQMLKAVGTKEFRINTSQTDQKVVMDLGGIQKYLVLLTTSRAAFIQRSVGAGVTSLTYRRTY